MRTRPKGAKPGTPLEFGAMVAGTAVFAAIALALGGPAPAAASAMAIVAALTTRAAVQGRGPARRGADAALCVALGNEAARALTTWLPMGIG